MIRNYRDLTRLEMEQVNREETIVLIPLGALEQHGNQALISKRKQKSQQQYRKNAKRKEITQRKKSWHRLTTPKGWRTGCIRSGWITAIFTRR